MTVMTYEQPATRTRPLAGQVALVTGGSRGIGRVLAQSLAAAGAAVAVTARSQDQLAETVALVQRQDGRALAVPADVANDADVNRMVAEVTRTLGPVDLLVNNAGLWGPIAPLWEADPDDWWRTMEIHVRGSFLCMRAVMPGMVARGRGRIVNMASNAGVHRWPTCSAYSVSKAAVVKLTENVAYESRRHGVSVFAFHPGISTIGLTDQAMAMQATPGSVADRAAGWIRQQVTDGQAVPPERAAESILTLASGRADALSGRYLTCTMTSRFWSGARTRSGLMSCTR
jgi:NAD(P)-dependent dehydrogenase (short-subunit alcohol dehydrogenase family)